MSTKIKIIVFLSAAIIIQVLSSSRPIPGYGEIFYGFGVQALTKGDTSKAKKYFEKALFHNGKFHQAYYELGLLYGQNGDEAKKIKFFRKAVDHGNTELEALYLAGLDYVKNDLIDKAINCFEKRNDGNSHWQLGEIYFQKGDYEKAMYHYNRTLAWGQNQVNAHYRLGLIAIKLNKKSEALDQIQELRTLNENSKVKELQSLLLKKDWPIESSQK